jgi:hypothetical protein
MPNKEKYEFDPNKKPSLKGKTIEDYKRIIDILYKELKRKDEFIDELKKEKEILMKTAFRAEKKVQEIQELFNEKLERKK